MLEILFYTSLWSTIIFDCISCWVLYDSFKRIKLYAVKTNLEINTKMMRFHLFSYALFLLSLFLFFGANIGGPKWFITSMFIFVELTNFFSQLLLMFIFNTICQKTKSAEELRSAKKAQRVLKGKIED